MPSPRPGEVGLSLHNHSVFSREKLDFLPDIALRIPFLAQRFERAVEQHRLQHGRQLDFTEVYWRPPLGPDEVVASERRQIAERFGRDAIVAITDHDTLDGPRRLRATGDPSAPLSVEWTVPFEGVEFHLGVQNLAAERLDEADRELTAYTKQPRPARLRELLAWLTEDPDTFIVLNHPFWDLRSVGALRHEAAVLSFLRAHRPSIHALELNGYRGWRENARTLPLAEGFGLPIVGGGDRHATAPSTIINFTPATTMSEFARGLRQGRATHCVILKEYREPLAARVLQGARDALGHHSRHVFGARRWVDRVFFLENGRERPLSAIWPHGGPWWLRAGVRVTRFLGSDSLRPAYRLAIRPEGAV